MPHNLDDPTLAQHAEAIRRLSRRVVADIIDIGSHLSEAKAKIGHGRWLAWLKEEFDWSADTASNFINVYKLSQRPKFRKVRNLNISASALYLLARKNTPETVRMSIIERAEAGEPISAQTVRLPISIQSVPLNAPYQRMGDDKIIPLNPLKAQNQPASDLKGLQDHIQSVRSRFELSPEEKDQQQESRAANQFLDLLCSPNVRRRAAQQIAEAPDVAGYLAEVQEATSEWNRLLAGIMKPLARAK